MTPLRSLVRRLSIVALSATPVAAQQAQRSADPLSRQIDRLFAAVDSTTAPGCAVSVARRGQPMLTRSYGLADLEAPRGIDAASVFEAGSVSKQFTAAAILLLALDGKLSLDDSVRRWIPEFPASAAGITIRQLLQHQAGLRDYGDIVELSGWPRGTRAYGQNEIVRLIARQTARNFAPGAEYSYSNSNFVIAAAIVERASGESFQSYSTRKIFAPLGMIRTRWRDDYTERVAGRTTAWTPNDAGAWHLDMPFENVVGHGGLLTTVADLQRWQANFVTPTVGGATFVAQMERAGVLRNGRVTGYALGLEVGIEHGAAVVSHAGSTAGYRAYVGRVPATGVAVALLCNNGAIRSDQLGPTLLAIANGDTSSVAEEEQPVLGPAVNTGELARRTGQYRNKRTEQPVQLRTFRDGVSLNTWVGFRARGAQEFVSEVGARVLRFDVGANAFRIIDTGVDTLRYERAPAWTPSAAQRRTFGGSYASADADALWRIVLEKDSLYVTRRNGQRDVMVPKFGDAFQVPSQGWLLTFRRNAAGGVSGFEVRTTRMRALGFVRSPDGTPGGGVRP